MSKIKITWGNRHYKYFLDLKHAYYFAYQKAFYYSVFINGIEYKRAF